MELFKKGDVVEGYRVLGELGQGAASNIYVVQDIKTKQVWALKHVKKEQPKDQRFLDQAESEYEISQRLDHPGIRKIERLIKKKQHLLSVRELFLVMEHVDGSPMNTHPPTDMLVLLDAISQIALGMAHMHSRGIVHADMKPHNVIVSESGVAKIIDLGQSCKIGTIKERIQGTPDYIAPEQVHRRAITPRTDIYNLGATMYWLLSGTNIPTAMPKGDSLVGSLDDHMIERAKPIKELAPHVDDRLAELVTQCIEIDASKRPDSMDMVADRLNLILGIARAERERQAKAAGGSPA